MGSRGSVIGTGGAMVSEPADGKLSSILQGQAAAVTTFAGSYIGGFFINWGGTIELTSIINGIALAIIWLLVSWGWEGSAVKSW